MPRKKLRTLLGPRLGSKPGILLGQIIRKGLQSKLGSLIGLSLVPTLVRPFQRWC